MPLSDLAEAVVPFASIGAGLGLLALFGRDPKTADEHDLSDYHARDESWATLNPRDLPGDDPVVNLADRPSWADWATRDQQPLRPALRPLEALTQPIELCAWTVPWKPPYADLIHAQVMRRYGDNPADAAGRFLRQLGEQARTAGAR